MAVLFFYLSPAMDNPHPKRRKSEIENLIGTYEDQQWRCTATDCPFYGTYKQVADHERRKHKIYQIKTVTEEKKPELFLCEFPKCTFYGIYEEVAAHEEKHNPDSPIKARTALPLLESLDKPEIRHIQFLSALTTTYFEREKKETKEKIQKQNKRRIAHSYARAEQLSNSIHQCPYCPQHFKLKFEHMNHMLQTHQHMFPLLEKNEAYLKRIERYKDTPDKIIVIN